MIKKQFTLNARVVGRQYYKNTTLTVGDLLRVEREPTNKYDPQALRVMNEDDEQVGHLRASFSKHAAPLIDKNRFVIVSATVTEVKEYDALVSLIVLYEEESILRKLPIELI